MTAMMGWALQTLDTTLHPGAPGGLCAVGVGYSPSENGIIELVSIGLFSVEDYHLIVKLLPPPLLRGP